MRPVILTPVLLLISLVLAPRAGAQKQLFQLDGQTSGDLYGLSVAAAGDVDADGTDDLLVGAPFDDPAGVQAAGTVWVHSGLDGSVLWTWRGIAMNDHLGWAVAGVGDVDGDGHADLAMSALRSSGINYVQLRSGATGSLIFQWSAAASTQYGYALHRAGDVDGDGVGDLLVGAPQPAGNGYAHVVSGASGFPIHVVSGATAGDLFGSAVAGGKDVDGDGTPDFVIGAPQLVGTGYVIVFSGSTGGWLWSATGGAGAVDFGHAVALGDANGDGRADFVAADPKDSTAASEAGQVLVINGASGALMAQLDGAAAGDRLGHAVAMLDVDADGFSDLAVGAPGDDSGGFEAGSVTVRSIASGSLLGYFTGGPSVDGAGHHLGSSVASLGDLNGDICAELAAGAPRELGSLFAGYVLVVEHGAKLGTPYCDSLPNSTGQTARLSAHGSPVVSSNDFHLQVTHCPPNQVGIFLLASGAKQTPFGDGILCLAGKIIRLYPAAWTDKAGMARRDLDLHAPPAQGWIVPGSGWNFQFWFRDAGGSAGTNFSSAVHVDFL